MVSEPRTRPRLAPGDALTPPTNAEGSVTNSSSPDILAELGEEFGCPDADGASGASTSGLWIMVWFFDDSDLEEAAVEAGLVEAYSCKAKARHVRAGLARLEEGRRGAMGANLRLAQFLKDVELAEVLTDQDPAVVALLARYEIHDIEEQMEEVKPAEKPKTKTKKLTKKGGRKKQTVRRDSLREIKNGGVCK